MIGNQFRASGWGLVLAAISLLITFLSDKFIPANAGPLLFLFVNLLITLELWGLYARYVGQIGAIAKIALWVGMVGGVVAIIGSIVLWTTGGENGRSLMNNAMAVLFGGLFIFGLLALREKPMRHWNGTLALAGVWWPLIVINANVFHQVTGRWPNITFWPSFVLFLGMSFSLTLLGYVLQSSPLPKQATG